jgi:hypothetical protein
VRVWPPAVEQGVVAVFCLNAASRQPVAPPPVDVSFLKAKLQGGWRGRLPYGEAATGGRGGRRFHRRCDGYGDPSLSFSQQSL